MIRRKVSETAPIEQAPGEPGACFIVFVSFTSRKNPDDLAARRVVEGIVDAEGELPRVTHVRCLWRVGTVSRA